MTRPARQRAGGPAPAPPRHANPPDKRNYPFRELQGKNRAAAPEDAPEPLHQREAGAGCQTSGPFDIFLFASSMIALDLQTFRQSRDGGNVTGAIYVELESGTFFPETGWSDFPVIIVSWWAEALLQLETPTRREVQWQFMDGPYSLTLTKMTGAVPSGALTFGQVESRVLEAAQRVVAYCEQHKMFSGDLETLRENVQRLKANQTVQRTGANRLVHIEIRPSAAAGSRR